MGCTIFNYDKGAFINLITKSIILCYVDDILITGPNPDEIMAQINNAKNDIKLQAFSKINTFLEINIKIDYKNKKLYIY